MGHKRRTKVQNKWLQRAAEFVRLRRKDPDRPRLDRAVAAELQRAYREGLADGHAGLNDALDNAIRVREAASDLVAELEDIR